MLFAVEGLLLPSYIEEVLEAVAGVLLVAAPWVLGYDSVVATINSMAGGFLVVVFAVWELHTDREFMTWWLKLRA